MTAPKKKIEKKDNKNCETMKMTLEWELAHKLTSRAGKRGGHDYPSKQAAMACWLWARKLVPSIMFVVPISLYLFNSNAPFVGCHLYPILTCTNQNVFTSLIMESCLLSSCGNKKFISVECVQHTNCIFVPQTKTFHSCVCIKCSTTESQGCCYLQWTI